MSKVAMFGGSFNPVHKGHTGIVSRMIEEFCLDTVYVIPTFSTPLKDNTPMVTPEHRLNMCRLAFADMDRVTVSDMEIQRQGRSYTVDTLRALKALHPNDELFLIVGADSFMQLPLWYESQSIFTLATMLTVSRGELEFDELKKRREEYIKLYGAKAEILAEPIALISSTEIRDTLADNNDASSMLHQNVYDYITECELYRYEH